jgi:hypothetical protein
MKKILVSLMVLLLTGVVYANKAERESKREARKEKRELKEQQRDIMEGVVSEKTEWQFALDFPNATDVAYTRTSNFEEAEFTLNGKAMTAYYDFHNELVGTTNEAFYSDIPISAQNEIRKFYQDYDVKQVIQFHDNQFNDTDMVLYGTSFEDTDNWFVELQKDSKKVIMKVSAEGLVSYYAQLK